MDIRHKVSKILDVLIQKNRWAQSINAIDAMGVVTKRKQLELIITLCESVEALEQQLADFLGDNSRFDKNIQDTILLQGRVNSLEMAMTRIDKPPVVQEPPLAIPVTTHPFQSQKPVTKKKAN